MANVCTQQDYELVNSCPSGVLSNHVVAVGCHMARWLRTERLFPLFAAFGRLYVVNDHRFTSPGLVELLKGLGVDTFICNEYSNHTNARSRLLRQHGIWYLHYGLGIVQHYSTSRFDWGMYDDDAWLRHATSPEAMPAESAQVTNEPIKRVLIIGQVPGDQAQQYGGRGFDMAQLVHLTRQSLPRTKLYYRPHPRTLERVAHLHLQPDNYLLHPRDDVPVLIDPRFSSPMEMAEIRKCYPDCNYWTGYTLADSMSGTDAAVMVNSTAAYECIQAGVPAYSAGIPLFAEHDGGNLPFHSLEHGKVLVSSDYQAKLAACVAGLQSRPGEPYTPEEFAEHLAVMQQAYGFAVPRRRILGVA